MKKRPKKKDLAIKGPSSEDVLALAFRAAKKMNNTYYKASVLTFLSRRAYKTKCVKLSENILRHAKTCARKTKYPLHSQAGALSLLAREHIRRKQYDPALKLLANILDFCKTYKDPHSIANGFRKLAELYVLLSKKKKALKYLKIALKIAPKIKAEISRLCEFCQIAETFAEAGDTRKALQILNSKALHVPRAIDSDLGTILKTYVKLGRKKKAHKHRAYKLLNIYKKTRPKDTLPFMLDLNLSFMQRSITKGLGENGEFKEGLKVARKITRPSVKVDALIFLASKMVKKPTPQALGLLNDINNALRKLDSRDKSLHAYLWSKLAGSYLKIGKKEKGLKILQKIVPVISKLKDQMGNSQIHSKLDVTTEVVYAFATIGDTNKAFSVIKNIKRKHYRASLYVQMLCEFLEYENSLSPKTLKTMTKMLHKL